jgi:hypothetical protein
MRAIGEGEAFWGSVQVATEERPEYSTTDDKAFAVAAEMEAAGSRSFVVVQGILKKSYQRRALIQADSPNMHRAPAQAQPRGGREPGRIKRNNR